MEILSRPDLHVMDLEALLDLLPVDQLISLARFPDGAEPYGRHLLYAGSEGEALIMGWRDDSPCAPHDHGAARGVVLILRGEGIEREWIVEEERVRPGRSRELVAPAMVHVLPGVVHSMTARGSAVTLHLYTPAITGMRVYDVERRRTLVVANDCGAWIPDDSLIRSEHEWNNELKPEERTTDGTTDHNPKNLLSTPHSPQ